jgi:hypothetical protein
VESGHVRMLVHKAGAVVDLVVHHEVDILLGGVLRDIGVGEFLVGHCCIGGPLNATYTFYGRAGAPERKKKRSNKQRRKRRE